MGVRPIGEVRAAEGSGELEQVLPGFHFQPLDVFALLPPGRRPLPRVVTCLEALRTAIKELS